MISFSTSVLGLMDRSVDLHMAVLLMILLWRWWKLWHGEDHFTAVQEENERSEEWNGLFSVREDLNAGPVATSRDGLTETRLQLIKSSDFCALSGLWAA